MIRPTRWESFLRFFANQSAQLAFNTICQDSANWKVAAAEVRSKDGKHIIEFNRELTRFTLVRPLHQPFGLFGSLLLRSLVKRIRFSYLQLNLK